MTPQPTAGRDEAASRPEASGAPVPEPTVRPTSYAVSCLPTGHRSARHFTVWVKEVRPGQWKVTNGVDVYDADGNECWGKPLPLEDEDAWRARHRFDLDTALALAKRIAPTLEINGLTVADALRMGADR